MQCAPVVTLGPASLPLKGLSNGSGKALEKPWNGPGSPRTGEALTSGPVNQLRPHLWRANGLPLDSVPLAVEDGSRAASGLTTCGLIRAAFVFWYPESEIRSTTELSFRVTRELSFRITAELSYRVTTELSS
jgi:hypothetical protein